MKFHKHFLSSAERTQGTNDRPVWILDNPIKKIKAFKCITAEIPKSYWSVDAISDTLVIQEDIGAPFLVSVANGNYILGYNTTTGAPSTEFGGFLAELKSKLDAASPNGYTYGPSYNPSTGLITITVSAGTFAILGSDTRSTLHLLIGFPAADTVQATSHVGSGVQRITTFPEYLFLRGTVGNSGYSSTIDNEDTATNIIARISTQSTDVQGIGPGRYILYFDNEVFGDAFKTDVEISRIELFLTHPKLNSKPHQQMFFFEVPWGITLAYYTDD